MQSRKKWINANTTRTGEDRHSTRDCIEIWLHGKLNFIALIRCIHGIWFCDWCIFVDIKTKLNFSLFIYIDFWPWIFYRPNKYVEPIVCSLKTAYFWDSSWWYRWKKIHRIIQKMIDHNPCRPLVHQTMPACLICKQIHKTVNRWGCSVRKRRIARTLTSLWGK